MERTTLTERLQRAEADIAASRSEQALANCQELQAAYPRALRVQRVLGEVYLSLRKPREALAALDRALDGDPEDVRACCARALVHQMHGDDVSALMWYRRACDLRPDDQSLRATYRDLARRLGEPPYRPSRAGLARLYLRGDLFAHAIREWEQLVNERPDMLDAQVGLAETLWRAGHVQAAEDRCHRILTNSPTCVKAMLILMALALADEDMDTARTHFERTLQLDPEMIIAQTCFVDELASGNPVMTALLRGASGINSNEAAMPMGRPTAGFSQSTPLAGQRNRSRPLVTSAPLPEPAILTPQQSGQPLPPPPPRPDVPVASQPTEVTRAFKETAFMIWGREEDSQPRVPAQRLGDAGDIGDGDRSSPPIPQGPGGTTEDAETRQALNWFNWLQAQGAVAMGAVSAPGAAAIPPEQILASQPMPFATEIEQPTEVLPAPSPKLTMPLPPSPLPSPRVTMPIAPILPSTPQGMEMLDDEPATMPLPRPSPESLRTMFAELGGDTAVTPAVGSGAQADLAGSAFTGPPANDAPAGEDAYTISADEPIDADIIDVVDADAPMGADDGADGSQPQTIEDLERQFAASGFSHIETRPGLLAKIEREQQPASNGTSAAQAEEPMASEPAPTLDMAVEDDRSAAVAYHDDTDDDTDSGDSDTSDSSNGSNGNGSGIRSVTSATVDETVASGPAPRDYPARLAHARQRRDGGQLDAALSEYRAIIKNAPDLLPEVLDDLHASMEQEPDNPTLHSVLGDALVSQGDYEAALESFNRATELAQARSGQP